MPDSFVQVAPDGGGKSIDSQAIQNAAGNTVYRQTICIADPSNISAVLSIDVSGILSVNAQLDTVKIQLLSLEQQMNNSAGQSGIGNGFLPIEIPTFLAGV